jgi:hypothetical protein
LRDVGAGEQELAGVLGELARQPPGGGLRADEEKRAPDGQFRCLLPAGIEQLMPSSCSLPSSAVICVRGMTAMRVFRSI